MTEMDRDPELNGPERYSVVEWLVESGNDFFARLALKEKGAPRLSMRAEPVVNFLF